MPPTTGNPPARPTRRVRGAGTHRVEAGTQRLGRAIFRRLRGRRPTVRDRAEQAMMEALMQDEELRYRMLLFVDVYPSLRGPGAIAEHLQEYLESDALSLGGDTGLMTRTARFVGRARRMTESPIAWASRFGIETMGRQFIAGANPHEVAPRMRAMEERGYQFSLDLLGEFVVSESQADDYQRRYREMIEGLGRLIGPRPPAANDPDAGPRVNISIKLSSLTSKFDAMDIDGTADAVLGRLRPLVRAARDAGAFLNIDMEKYEYRDATLEIIQRLLLEDEFAGFEQIGCVFQAYLLDGEQSLRGFLAWLRQHDQQMTIRLVKGAYWDSEQIWARTRGWPVPVITNKRETDAQFERMTRMLLENSGLVRTAIASHNVRSIAHGLALRQALRVPRDRVELQMLFGMGDPIADACRAAGVPVRIYTPCGELIPGMAYLVRRILENTSNESFLRQRFTDGVAEDRLLADPKQEAPR